MKTSTQVMTQIRNVIINIMYGRYEHNQSAWHCGTAACIAGWCQLEDISKEKSLSFYDIQLSLIESDDSEVPAGYENAETHVLKHVHSNYLRTDIEDLIFKYDLTLDEIIDGFNKTIVRNKVNVSPIIRPYVNVLKTKVKV